MVLYDCMVLANWELMLGIGNIILAIAVVGVTIYNNKRNRRVHLADKRKDWLVEFRSKVAELTAMLTMMKYENTVFKNKMESFRTDKDVKIGYELLEEIQSYNKTTSRYLTLINELTLLSFEDGDDVVSSTNMGALLDELLAMQTSGEDEKASKLAVKIMSVANTIIAAKWEKIKDLKG
ncbi:MAG: hypothetical protein RIB79_11410 [Allomuricauda sp.]|jgi:hypothetical protein